VSPELTQLSKGEDGLFYMQNGESVKMDEKLRIAHGALEGSNVNTVETLTKLIELSRHFEVHTNLMKTMQENATKANQILELQG
jgi:flagellar basal-body rod protein FlgF